MKKSFLYGTRPLLPFFPHMQSLRNAKVTIDGMYNRKSQLKLGRLDIKHDHVSWRTAVNTPSIIPSR